MPDDIHPVEEFDKGAVLELVHRNGKFVQQTRLSVGHRVKFLDLPNNGEGWLAVGPVDGKDLGDFASPESVLAVDADCLAMVAA